MKKKAFTLIELLVVVAIISILVSLILPILSSVVKHRSDSELKGGYVHVPAVVPVVTNVLGIKDMVVINGVNITGVVTNIRIDNYYDILTTDGKIIPKLNRDLLTKFPPVLENR